jgi:eukaryotic-like serine/threonine-protein kinase
VIVFQAGDVFAGRFRLEERIGQGGMGQVWRATQLGLNREVALKLILPSAHDDDRFREMFLLEARISARLSHPNIVPVVDFGEHEGGILWLVQIFVQGQDLGRVLEAAGGGLPVALAGHIVTQVLFGLQAAHDQGVVHRDIKPGNVLVSHAGDVLITDFGIAKVIAADQTPSISTIVKGSPGYLAPEILRGQPPRFTADLFAVGGLLYELVTGRNPFVRSLHADREQIFYATLNEPVPPLVDAPPGLEAVVQRLLAKDPAARYQTASQALDDLLGALAPLAREASPLALRRFLAATRKTYVAPGPRKTGGRTVGVSAMAGQVATGAPPRGPTRAKLAAVTMTAVGAAVLAFALLRGPWATEPAALGGPAASTVAADADAGALAPPALADAAPPADAAPADAAWAVDAAPVVPRGPPTEKRTPRQPRRDEGGWMVPERRSRDDLKMRAP